MAAWVPPAPVCWSRSGEGGAQSDEIFVVGGGKNWELRVWATTVEKRHMYGLFIDLCGVSLQIQTKTYGDCKAWSLKKIRP